MQTNFDWITADDAVMQRARDIKLVSFDVDGVLTDAKLFFDYDGREYKSFNAKDGLGIKLLQHAGIEVAIISGRHSPAVERRMEGLGIKHCFQGIEDKLSVLPILQAQMDISPDQIAHVGDDLIDLPLLRRVGLAIGVEDAHASILPYLHYQTRLRGGQGAAREVCDLILVAQNHMHATLKRFL